MIRINERSRPSSASIRPRSSSTIVTGLKRPLPMRADKAVIDSNAGVASDMVIPGKWDCTVPRSHRIAQGGIPVIHTDGEEHRQGLIRPLFCFAADAR